MWIAFFVGFFIGICFIIVLSAALASGRNPLIKQNKFDNDCGWDNDGGRGE